MIIKEVILTDDVLNQLIDMTKLWEKENITTGYIHNHSDSFTGYRVFAAYDDKNMIGYLYGKKAEAKDMGAVIPDQSTYFEIEEFYIHPDYRSQGIGRKMYAYLEEILKPEADYIFLGTATKDWKSVLHFYIEEMGMEFWYAILFKKISK